MTSKLLLARASLSIAALLHDDVGGPQSVFDDGAGGTRTISSSLGVYAEASVGVDFGRVVSGHARVTF